MAAARRAHRQSFVEFRQKVADFYPGATARQLLAVFHVAPGVRNEVEFELILRKMVIARKQMLARRMHLRKRPHKNHRG